MRDGNRKAVEMTGRGKRGKPKPVSLSFPRPWKSQAISTFPPPHYYYYSFSQTNSEHTES